MNDNRITTVEAARLCGLTRQAITARIKRDFYQSAARLGRDWTLDRTEVEASAKNPPRVGRKRKPPQEPSEVFCVDCGWTGNPDALVIGFPGSSDIENIDPDEEGRNE